MQKLNISYNRKSTEEADKQIQSIDSQVYANNVSAKRLGIKIDKQFTESKSAKKPNNRPEFEAMIKLINEGKVNYLFVWKLDRLARNPVDFGTISYILQQKLIKAIVTPEKEYRPEDNALLPYVEFGMANQFIRELGQNVKRGLNDKVNKGYKPGKTPLGYLNDYGGYKGEKVVFKDPERFDKVKELWDYAATGQYSLVKLAEIANKKLKLTQRNRIHRKEIISPIKPSLLWRLFTNPYYYGKFLWKGELKTGKHEPMITQALFDKVQHIFKSTGRPRGSKRDNLYSGLMQCGECGFSIITEPTKYKTIKKTGEIKGYEYLHCSHKSHTVKCRQVSVTADKLESQFFDGIRTLEVGDEFIEWGRKWLREYANHEIYNRKELEAGFQKELDGIKDQLDNLTKLMLSPQNSNNVLLSIEEFGEQKKLLIDQKGEILGKLKGLDSDQNELIESIIQKLEFTKDLAVNFKIGNKEEKQTILRTLARTITLKDKKVHLESNLEFIRFQELKKETDSNPAWLELNPTNTDKGNQSFSVILNKWSARRDSNS